MTPDPGLLARLAAGAEAADRRPDWPADSWAALRDGGVLGWAVPREYGGAGLGPAELLAAGEALAAACLTTAFVLSQRDAAVRRLLAGPDCLRGRLEIGLPGRSGPSLSCRDDHHTAAVPE